MKDSKINILSKSQNNVEKLIKRIGEVWKNKIQGKRNAFKKDKEEIQKRSNKASQLLSSTQYESRSHPNKNDGFD